MSHHEHAVARVTAVGPAGILPPGQPARRGPGSVRRAVAFLALSALGAGLGAFAAEVTPTQALMTSAADKQVNSLTALTCLEPGQQQPAGAHLKKCPATPPPPPAPKCEDVLDSQAPASQQNDPIGTVPVNLSAVYHDESAMDTVTKPPTLTIDGNDQPGAWGTTLTVTADSSTTKDFHTTVSYTVPNSYGDGELHTFVVTFYDTDKSVGCGVATFYVQSPPATQQPIPSCQENVVDKNNPPTPSSTAANPISALPATLTVAYADESPMATTTNPPMLTVDGVAKTGANLTVNNTSSGNNYNATVSYQVADTFADGQPHTFVITVYDTDHSSGCGIGTFYLNVPKP